jgi:hypothetical protein
MILHKKQQQKQSDLENKVKEINNNIRHITQLAMSWFVFFVTINYASMGWLATSSVNFNRTIIVTIAGVFIVQNILGMVSLRETEKAIKKMSDQIECYEKLSIDEDSKWCHGILESQNVPIELCKNLRKYMSWVLFSLIAAWVIYAIMR